LNSLDEHIVKVREYVEALGQRRAVREIRCSTEADKLIEGLPVRIGPQPGNNIILREDTAVELGNPSVGSCAFVLWTTDCSLVRNGRVTLVGPDMQEGAAASLPFAQVLIVGGTQLMYQHHLVLEQHYAISGQIEGYMVRLAPQQQRMWTRVSKKAVEKGFSFETLGRAVMAIYRVQLPAIETIEAIFITSSREDVEGLQPIGQQVRKIKNDALSDRFARKDDGSYECKSTYVDCTDCPDQDVCDEIRDLIRLRRKSRERQGHV
jgi:acetyl-CoA decarbonylase/synthase complex subunit beta